MQDIFVNTFEGIDFNYSLMPIITISFTPNQTKPFTARLLFKYDRTNIVMVRETIEDIYLGMPQCMKLVISNHWDELNSVIEVWGLSILSEDNTEPQTTR